MEVLRPHQFRRAEALAAAAGFADQKCSPLARLAADLEMLKAEISAPFPDTFPTSAIELITCGGREHAAIAALMLHDCRQRSADGTLNSLQLANLENWIAGSRRWLAGQRAACAAKARRKFFVVRSATASARRATSGRM